MTKACETCQQPFTTSHQRQKYCCRAHVPVDVQTRRMRTLRSRRFREDLARLPQRLTRDDLLLLCQTVYYRGWQAGCQMRIQQGRKASAPMAKAS